MVADAVEAVSGELADEADVGLVRGAEVVLVEALIGAPVVRLGVLHRPGGDLVGVDPQPVVLDPGHETVQRLVVVVFGDAGAVAVVPVVDSADEVVAVDATVGEQRAAVEAAPVEHRCRIHVGPADDDEVDVADQRVRRRHRLQLAPGRDPHALHRTASLSSARVRRMLRAPPFQPGGPSHDPTISS